MSDIFSALSVLAFMNSVAALFFVARIATQLRELRAERLSLSASRVKSLETSLEDLQGAVLEVANRVKMIKVRNSANHVGEKKPNGMPDPYTNPDEWRAAMNGKLARARLER